MDEIKVPVTKKTCLYIRPMSGVDATEGIFAINWLDTRMNWLYSLYGVLAYPLARRIEAKAIFKGTLTERLYGRPEDGRSVLLIVKYPSIHRFAKLLSYTYFKLISVFRTWATDRFTFGFTTAQIKGRLAGDRSQSMAYAIHHYIADKHMDAQRISDLTNGGVHVFYMGYTSALLFVGDPKAIKRQVPCLMDGLIVYAADDASALRDYFATAAYQSIIEETKTSFIGLLKHAL